MNYKIKIVLTIVIGMFVISASKAQVYVGGGRVISQFSPETLDENRGYGVMLQKQIYFEDSKFSLTPSLQASLLTDKQYFEFLQEFYTSISLGTHLNYDIIKTRKIKLSPFIGPSFYWITGLQAGGAVLFEPETINFYRIGIESGLSATYTYSEKFSVKFIPLMYTFGTNDFVQGNVFTLLFQIGN